MRWTWSLPVVLLVGLPLSGCLKSNPPPDPASVTPGGLQASPVDRGEDPPEPDGLSESLADGRDIIYNADTGEFTVEGEDAPDDDVMDEFGFIDDIGDLPPCDLTNGIEGDGRIVRYADLDGDLVPEALIVGARPKKAGGSQPRSRFFTAYYNDGEWVEWHGFMPEAGEDGYDEDTIAFAYDINEDGIVELGLVFNWEKDDGYAFSGIYLFHPGEDGLIPLRDPDEVEALYGNEYIITGGHDAITLADVSSNAPGEELVVASPVDTADTEPTDFGIYIYGWLDGYYVGGASAQTDQEFEDADAALEAFIDGTGGFEQVSPGSE